MSRFALQGLSTRWTSIAVAALAAGGCLIDPKDYPLENTAVGGGAGRGGSGGASGAPGLDPLGGANNAPGEAGAAGVDGDSGEGGEGGGDDVKGAASEVAGSNNDGHGGASAGSASAGAAPSHGGAGGSQTTGCTAATGTAADLSIDDFEDGDFAIQAIGMRKGFWYTYNDGTAVQVPTTSSAMPFKAMAAGHSVTSTTAGETSGPKFMTWGAGLSFDFNNSGDFACPYDATAYSGITFWAKTTAAFKAMVQIPATKAKMDTSDSATCVSTTMCNDHYYVPVPMTAVWTQFTIAFADSTTFKQEGWGVKTAFDKARLLGMQFQVPEAVAFDIVIDDLTFF